MGKGLERNSKLEAREKGYDPLREVVRPLKKLRSKRWNGLPDSRMDTPPQTLRAGVQQQGGPEEAEATEGGVAAGTNVDRQHQVSSPWSPETHAWVTRAQRGCGKGFCSARI